MGTLLTLFFLVIVCSALQAQQGFAYTHITTDDGIGLASNVVTSLYQDEKGFIWVGTDNGLQRFDGSKFIHFSTSKAGSDQLPHASVSQIIPADSSKLVLALNTKREFGLFDPSRFTYKKIPVKSSRPISPRAEFHLWKDSQGEIYLNILRAGMMHYDKKQNAFVDNNPFRIPKGWHINLLAAYEDHVKDQYWFGCDSGLVIYDRITDQSWTKNFNPHNLAILNNETVQDNPTQLNIDKQRRIWIFNWPVNGGQYKHCLDSAGGRFLTTDTIGLSQGPTGYVEYNNFYETREGDLWIYGSGILYNYDKISRRWNYNKRGNGNDNISIDYDAVFQVIEDRDESMWIATDKGLYFTSHGSGEFSLVNVSFNSNSEATSITDILEMPDGNLWFTSWGSGVKVTDKLFRKIPNYVYNNAPPANWPGAQKAATKLTWSMCRQSSTGYVWIGCNGGILLVHDPATRTTKYLTPPELNQSTVRYIAENKNGDLWFGTQGGRLVKWSNNQFTVVKDMGTIIYKVFFDKQGWMWLATHEKGLYAINPTDGSILQHYAADGGKNALYGNTGDDIEQLNDSIIVFGAGALHFINKKTGSVNLISYEDGLPSNTVKRLRMDRNGSLWIITSNGLCRYNPVNNQINIYGRKDGVVLAEQTSNADFLCSNDYIVFGGSNAVLMFNPNVFSTTKAPPDVTITDFKLYNQFVPVDSLMQYPEVKLQHDQNSISIYFASLSYTQRDKLTYYYKMEGIDKDWIRADRSYYANYSLLPPGTYTFKVYCQNIEGKRSAKTTELIIRIKPPFWRTWWFISTLLFVVALLIYAVHDLRVNRLLAVEKLRNRVARDLHDDMGSTLSTINILSSMAKSKMSADPVKTAEYLSKISDNSQRMMEAMDDIVWSIKPSNDSMQKISARMREFATNVLEAKNMDLDFFMDDDVYDIKLNMEKRRDFFLIFKEAVNNAAKYSKASRVWIQVSLEHKLLTLKVKDNGIGFDVIAADGGNGLGNMHKRADAMNGRISIESNEGKGSVITLSIPIQ
jgi:signal transduction histidine kinase/ligand-binding sensor domain-containing protein